ncbi:c-type cytochrome [Pedobacter sp. JY14-1]|uniref:c-type cytochrome n=1 Tax=Pedobacter sp. JY14-1 TaxID=3034151 RepID=UPI0023E12384|nr:c-type cytochrome [Pedobacter sp. JY14-1]
MKKTLLFLSCVALAWASCHSPEERAAMKASADSAAHGKIETTGPSEPAGDTAAAPKPDTATAVSAEPKVGPPVVTATETPAPKPEKLAGEGLIQKSDCLACHNVSKKIVGPAYKAVAAKYEANDANIEALAEKIINGGAGVWGAVPMSPHPALSKTDAKEMVKYILSLKK